VSRNFVSSRPTSCVCFSCPLCLRQIPAPPPFSSFTIL
jgi:hypothetical protein